MIDPAIISAALAVAIIGGVGAVILAADTRKRDLDAEGHFPGFDREFSDADRAAIKGAIVLDPRPEPGIKRPDAEFAMKRHAAMAGSVHGARYIVPRFAGRDGFWRVYDMAAPIGERKSKAVYSTRSTALRAARRLNAKAEIAKAAGGSQ